MQKQRLVSVLNRAILITNGSEHTQLVGEMIDVRDALEREIKQEKENEKPVGICPACSLPVFNSLEVDGPVWICPADLSPNNRYWQPSDVTEEIMEKDGDYSLCWANHGGSCIDDMPLHSDCYDKGDY